MMESKGIRGSRNAAPIEFRTEAVEPAETQAPTAEPTDPAIEAPYLAEVPVEPAETMETAAASPAMPEFGASAGAAKSEPVSLSAAGTRRDAVAPWIQAQAALAHGLEAISAEMAGLALKSIDATASAASKLLGVKTLSDAIAVNAGFTCSSFDALLGGSARLSELGVKLAAETSQPLLSQFGRAWVKAARPAR
jgi:hypothetical protein